MPKKEPSTHIDNPASAIPGYPAFNSAKKSPAKAKLIRISNAAALAPMCSVYFLEWVLRVGEENGTLKAKVVKRKRISPKGQIECSLQTPLLRR